MIDAKEKYEKSNSIGLKLVINVIEQWFIVDFLFNWLFESNIGIHYILNNFDLKNLLKMIFFILLWYRECSVFQFGKKYGIKGSSLRGHTLHSVGANFGVGVSLKFRDKSSTMLKFHRHNRRKHNEKKSKERSFLLIRLQFTYTQFGLVMRANTLHTKRRMTLEPPTLILLFV